MLACPNSGCVLEISCSVSSPLFGNVSTSSFSSTSAVYVLSSATVNVSLPGLGTSLTGVTVSVNVALSCPPSASVTRTVIRASPTLSAFGRTVKVQLPSASGVTVIAGSRTPFRCVAVTESEPAAVSTSLTLKVMLPVRVSSGVVTFVSVSGVITGRSLMEVTITLTAKRSVRPEESFAV